MDAFPKCGIKTRLLTDYKTATAAYSRAVSDLSRIVGKTTRMEFDRLNMLTERARIASADARTNLDDHIIDHGC